LRFPLSWSLPKMAPTASSPAVKLVIMSIKPLAVMGVLWPSSQTNSL
jgi:hypothetical protein